MHDVSSVGLEVKVQVNCGPSRGGGYEQLSMEAVANRQSARFSFSRVGLR